jgi:hypothetical protein
MVMSQKIHFRLENASLDGFIEWDAFGYMDDVLHIAKSYGYAVVVEGGTVTMTHPR